MRDGLHAKNFEWIRGIVAPEALLAHMRGVSATASEVHSVAAAALRDTSIWRLSSDPEVRLDANDMTHSCETIPVVDQMDTGTCWLQAGTAFLSTLALRHGLKLRLSVPYLAFYDKLNKALVFLERARVLAPHGGKTTETASFLNEHHELRAHFLEPIQDGGTWNMFVHLVTTYGVVLHDSMPPTHQTENTRALNVLLNDALRGAAFDDSTTTVMDTVLEALLRTFTTPPDRVVLTKGSHGRDVQCHPRELLALLLQEPPPRILGVPWPLATSKPPIRLEHDFVVLVDAPDRPHGGYCGPASNDVRHLDTQDRFHVVDQRCLSKACIESLRQGIPVWFGCNTKLDFSPSRGMAAKNLILHNAQSLLGVRLQTDKKARMLRRNTAPEHAMLLTGVKLSASGRPLHWKIQNSWGEDFNGAGFLVVDHEWFKANVFEVAVHRATITISHTQHFVKLPPWDIFGTVAH